MEEERFFFTLEKITKKERWGGPSSASGEGKGRGVEGVLNTERRPLLSRGRPEEGEDLSPSLSAGEGEKEETYNEREGLFLPRKKKSHYLLVLTERIEKGRKKNADRKRRTNSQRKEKGKEKDP